MIISKRFRKYFIFSKNANAKPKRIVFKKLANVLDIDTLL